jgi:hypothetical protein
MQDLIGTWISPKIHEIFTHNPDYSNWVDAYPNIGYVQLIIQEASAGLYSSALSLLNEKNEVYELLAGETVFKPAKILIYTQETEPANILEFKKIRPTKIKCRVFGKWILLKKDILLFPTYTNIRD